MAHELSLINAVEGSNIPQSQKKSLVRFYSDRLRGGGGSVLARAKAHVIGGAHVLRQGGESGIVGAVLGGLHAHTPTGLDHAVGSSGKTIPIDGVVAAAGLASSVLWAHEPMADDLRNAGSAAAAVFFFRKTHDWAAKRLAAQGVTPGSTVSAQSSASTPAATGAAAAHNGDFGDDPIVALARQL